jgi:hypothetical protein
VALHTGDQPVWELPGKQPMRIGRPEGLLPPTWSPWDFIKVLPDQVLCQNDMIAFRKVVGGGAGAETHSLVSQLWG